MTRRRFTVDRHTKIERRLTAGRSVREIARALGCSRRTVREVRRDGLRTAPGRTTGEPPWMAQVDWPAVLHEVGFGHPLKFIWEERAQPLTTYPNFWKQFYRKFPDRKQASVTARDFAPGERVEVDYAGDPLAWVDVRTGELHRAWVFVAGLGCSQLLFAWAADDMKSHNLSLSPPPACRRRSLFECLLDRRNRRLRQRLANLRHQSILHLLMQQWPDLAQRLRVSDEDEGGHLFTVDAAIELPGQLLRKRSLIGLLACRLWRAIAGGPCVDKVCGGELADG